MHRRMASRVPACSLSQQQRVIGFSDKNLPRRTALNLRMTPQAQIRIARDQHLSTDRPMRLVTNSATFSQRLMLENERPRLIPMAVGAILIQARHRQSAGGLEDVRPVRVMTLHAVHPPLDNRMMLRQIELGPGLQVAFETRTWIFPRIDNEFPAAASALNVLAPRAMA